MSGDHTLFDDILEQLAQGETYAARDDSATIRRQGAPDVSDAGLDVSRPVGGFVAPGHGSRRVLGAPGARLERTGAVLLLPRPAALVRVFSVAVVLMMAVMTALAAIVAQSVETLTGELHGDARFNPAATLHDQPVDHAILLDEEAFAALLAQWPQQAQLLWLKRFRACQAAGRWEDALTAFQRAEALDAAVVPVVDRLELVDVLIRARAFEAAADAVGVVPADRLDAPGRERLAGLVTRLQLARAARSAPSRSATR